MTMQDDGDDMAEDSVEDHERGYNGTTEPVQIEDVEHATGPAVVLGSLRHDGHIIHAEGMGVLIVENAPEVKP